jgi:hypothetical protein
MLGHGIPSCTALLCDVSNLYQPTEEDKEALLLQTLEPSDSDTPA